MNDRSPHAIFQSECNDIASRSRRSASTTAFAIILFSAATTAALVLFPSPRPFLATLLILLTLASVLATLATSALLWFDAALFTLMATFPDETSAGHAVDEFLARAKLKLLPQATRPLADRIAGTRRLMRRQLMLAAASAVFAVLAFAANFA